MEPQTRQSKLVWVSNVVDFNHGQLPDLPRQRAELQRQLVNEFTQEKLLHIPGA